YYHRGKELATLTQSLRELETRTFEDLVKALEDVQQIADGYKMQDLALSLLVSRHSFDLERGLGSKVSAKRLFKYVSHDNVAAWIILYPGLLQEQFARCTDFAKKEKWPFTAQGLLARYRDNQDPLLKETFLQTDEYRLVQILLCRNTCITKEQVFELVNACDWKVMKGLYDEMQRSQDFSPEVRRAFLLGALPHSAEILV